MTEVDQERLEAIRSQFSNAINEMADKRMSRLAAWFADKFPKHTLEVLFGNGDELILVNRRQIHLEDGRDVNISRHARPLCNGRYVPCLNPIHDALKDVWDITDGYRVGCPDNVRVIKGKVLERK